MNLQESIRRILREDKKTKSTNKEFSKYKNSKFGTLKDYTLQDIVDNWDSLSDHKNENIKTIKYFINNPDKITDLVYDEKGLEDGYHRLIAAKILKKPRFSYRLVENLQESIRRILREENEGHKLKFVIRMIYTLYDEVSFIEQSTYNDKPLLKIYFDSDDTAANIESWFDEKISRDIDKWTSGNIVVCPTWMFDWDVRKKNADVFIETELLKYDNLGNVINESVLREEKELPIYFKRRIDMETLEQIYQYVLKVVSKRYTDKKKQLNAMTPYKFNHLVTSNLIEEVSENFELIWDDDGERFNQLWDFLNDRYSKRNIKHFYEIR